MASSVEVQAPTPNSGIGPRSSAAMHMNIFSLCSPVVRAAALEGHVRICLAQYALLAEMQKKNSADSSHKAGIKTWEDMRNNVMSQEERKRNYECLFSDHKTHTIHVILSEHFLANGLHLLYLLL